MGTTGENDGMIDDVQPTAEEQAATALQNLLVTVTGRMPPAGACKEFVGLLTAAARDSLMAAAIENMQIANNPMIVIDNEAIARGCIIRPGKVVDSDAAKPVEASKKK